MSASKGNAKRIRIIFVGILILVIGYFLPAPEGLGHGGKMTLVLLAFLFVMWTTGVVPNWVSSMAAILMLPFFDAAENHTAVYESFVNSTFFFLLAVFAIAAIIHKSNIPSKLMNFFVVRFENDSRKLLFAFGATTWIISAFMSDLAACALVAGVAAAILRDGKFPKSFSRCLMMIIPLGSMTGGIIMPISSATNATIMQKLEILMGETTSFLQWTVVGLPVGVLGLVLAWAIMVAVHRPEHLSEECMADLRARFTTGEGFSSYDKKVLMIVGVMLVMWVLGSWVPVLSHTFVALVGMIAMFLPGFDMLTWKEFREEVHWDLLLFVGALFSLTTSMVNTGAIDWIMNAALGATEGWSPMLFFVAMSVVLCLIRGVLPGGPLLVGMVTPAVLAMGAAFDLDPMVLLVSLSVWGQVSALLPIIDAQWLMTYDFKYFSVKDLLKVGVPWTIVFIALMAVLLPPLADFSAFAAI